MTHDRMLSSDKIMSKYSPESWSTNVLLSQQDVKWRNPQCKQIMIKYQRNYRHTRFRILVRWTLSISSTMRRRIVLVTICKHWYFKIGRNYLRRPIGGDASARWSHVITCHWGRSQSIARLRLRAPSGRVLGPECAGPSESEIKQNIAHSMLDFGGTRGQRCSGESDPVQGELIKLQTLWPMFWKESGRAMSDVNWAPSSSPPWVTYCRPRSPRCLSSRWRAGAWCRWRPPPLWSTSR